MKWIGQHIVDFIARFRSDVYLESIADGTVASDKFLGLDSNNKIVKETVSAAVTDLTSVGVNGDANQLLTDDGDGTITSEPYFTHLNVGGTTPTTTLSSGAIGPWLKMQNTAASSIAPYLYFTNQRGSSAVDAVDGDDLGHIRFTGYDDGTPTVQTYAEIFSEIINSGSGAETGRVELKVAEYDGTLTTGLKLDGQDQDGEIDVTIAAGAASTTTIAGTLTMGSTASMTNAGLLSVGNQTGITGTGALNSGSITSGFGNIDNGSNSLTTRTLTADFITVQSRVYALPGTSDGDHAAGDVVYFGGTTGLTEGKCYYFTGGGVWEPSNGGADATATGLLAIALGAASDVNGMLLRGMVTPYGPAGTDDHGKKVYLRAQDGALTTDIPTGSGQFVRIVGYMLDDVSGGTDAIYFCPDNTYVEIA